MAITIKKHSGFERSVTAENLYAMRRHRKMLPGISGEQAGC